MACIKRSQGLKARLLISAEGANLRPFRLQSLIDNALDPWNFNCHQSNKYAHLISNCRLTRSHQPNVGICESQQRPEGLLEKACIDEKRRPGKTLASFSLATMKQFQSRSKLMWLPSPKLNLPRTPACRAMHGMSHGSEPMQRPSWRFQSIPRAIRATFESSKTHHENPKLTRGARSAAAEKRMAEFLDNRSYEELGFSEAVASTMRRAGFPRPSKVQALASREMLAGKNVVLAAETGSGKTLAYFLPILEARLNPSRSDEHERALVLCPNTTLCNQVISVADSLRGEDGSQLVKAVRISSRSPPPSYIPDILVSTPAGLISAAREYKNAHGSTWDQASIIARTRWLVVDEADLLMSGGYEQDTAKILQSMKTADNVKKAEQISKALGISLEEFQTIPRLERGQALKGDISGAKRILMQRKREDQEQTGQKDPVLGSNFAGLESVSDTFTFHGMRQYAFVAATMPHDSKKSVGSAIVKMCPDAVWRSGRQLHQGVNNVKHEWYQVDEYSRDYSLQRALQGGHQGKTLVFANTVQAAKDTASVLQKAGIKPFLYHSDMSQADKEHVLSSAASQGDIVIVSTDSASRGIDIPDISHVVQADFAASAVDFLHRVGRTGRAGKQGLVTSLYDAPSKILAEAIRNAIDNNVTIEGTFSRNRSFRNKVRKFGKYVPRGVHSTEVTQPRVVPSID